MGTREDIIAAAARIMRDEGYARATTKEIARAAGYSEAALYKHFHDKTEIFVSVLTERLPGLVPLLGDLQGRAGEGAVRDNLVDVARTAIAFYAESFPLSASVFSSRQLLAAHRERLRELAPGSGPDRPLTALAAYLRAERDGGRVPAEVDPGAAAALLLGACFQQAFLVAFTGDRPDGDTLHDLAADLVGALVACW
ncbi:TetR/AcrR family transcriptional regulator [Prauserella flavalba]|uniref:TetR/AcrR family transcriptional regulator n=1 Tax=Prauserella flavalba TaxID=1477506 RepID=UPI0036EF3594